MFSVSIIFLTLLIPSLQSSKPTLKLTFNPDEKYYTPGHVVDIQCELIDPKESTDSPQLWHIDIKTGKRTSFSRSLLTSPADDAPDVFKNNKIKRLQFVKKNHLRIGQIHVEDIARYECNCPDCEEPPTIQTKQLQVVKLADPKWHIDPSSPIQENAKTILKCTADDFYPYVSHQILRNNHKMPEEGKVVIPNSNSYPHKFSWEATVTPTSAWHNSTLKCVVIEGNHERHTSQVIEIIFSPRFTHCEEKQHVNSTKDNATIECSYEGNPRPTLTWLRATDEKPITSDAGITIDTKDLHHGKYKSIVTFDREKLSAIPLTTTTKAPNAPADTTTPAQTTLIAANYYQQLLSSGFIARLTHNNEVKDSKKIHIVNYAKESVSKILGSSARKIIENLSTSMLFFSSAIILYMIQRR